MIKTVICKIEEIIWGPQFLILFILIGFYLTVKLKAPQIKALKVIGKTSDQKTDGITSFKALMTVLAGTLGIGNITGVATAIMIGGIGSIFWIFISGIVAMAISYAENYLVLKYRKKDKAHGYFGGAMYILDEVMGKRLIAILFCIFTLIATIGMGAMVQANSLTEIISEEAGGEKGVIACIITVISLYVIFGGKHNMANLNSIVIPFCTLTYVVLCGVVIVTNFEALQGTVIHILKEAFGIKQVVGGTLGVSVMKCISVGFSRGMFSNEAGMGSTPMFAVNAEDAKSLSDTAYIMSFSVFIDTIFLCVLTGLAIVVSGAYNISNIPVMLSVTFSSVPFGNTLLMFCISAFAIATIPCWEFYGEQVLRYLFKKDYAIYLYKIVYVVCVYIGCMLSLDLVWSISNTANALMALPNIYMIFYMRKELTG